MCSVMHDSRLLRSSATSVVRETTAHRARAESVCVRGEEGVACGVLFDDTAVDVIATTLGEIASDRFDPTGAHRSPIKHQVFRARSPMGKKTSVNYRCCVLFQLFFKDGLEMLARISCLTTSLRSTFECA
jgi:hypothetical protein